MTRAKASCIQGFALAIVFAAEPLTFSLPPSGRKAPAFRLIAVGTRLQRGLSKMKSKSDAGLADCPGNLGDLYTDLGFKAGNGGTHSARTMMPADLTALLSNAPAHAKRDDFNKFIVEENCLGKKTTSNRWLTAWHLADLYGLGQPGVPAGAFYRCPGRRAPAGSPGAGGILRPGHRGDDLDRGGSAAAGGPVTGQHHAGEPGGACGWQGADSGGTGSGAKFQDVHLRQQSP